MSEVREWLERLYGRSPGYFTIVPFAHGKPRTVRWARTDQLDDAARAISRYAKDYDMYVSVGTWKEPAEKGRGRAKDVISLPGLWADLDIGTVGHEKAKLPNPSNEAEALAILDGLPAPTAVVHSGGGLQTWHFFDEPWVFDNNDDAVKLAASWSRRLIANGEERGFHVDSIGDLARILRVPGTANLKTDQPRPVVLRDLRDDTYSPEQLAVLGIEGDGPDQDAGDSDHADDDFPHSWEWILGPHGWVNTGDVDSDGDPLWRRPGKTEGRSAVTHPRVMVNWSGSCGLPVEKGMSKLFVYAFLNFDGDMKAAKRALGIGAKLRVFRRADLKTLPEVTPLIEDVVSLRSSVIMVGPSRIGKTFTALSFAASIATNTPWFGQNVLAPSPVLYIVGEGAGGLEKRVNAWEQEFYGGKAIDNEMLSFIIRPPSLLDPDTWLAIREEARRLGVRFVAMDTLSSLAPDADETSDAAKIIRRLTDLSEDLNGTAMLMHHPGWSSPGRVRGGSQLEANVDEVLLLDWQIDDTYPDFIVRRKKVKNGEGGRAFYLRRVSKHNSQVLEEYGEPTDADVHKGITDDSKAEH